jgi:hypothetical protein
MPTDAAMTSESRTAIMALPHIVRVTFRLIQVTIRAAATVSAYCPVGLMKGPLKPDTLMPVPPPVSQDSAIASSTTMIVKASVAMAK